MHSVGMPLESASCRRYQSINCFINCFKVPSGLVAIWLERAIRQRLSWHAVGDEPTLDDSMSCTDYVVIAIAQPQRPAFPAGPLLATSSRSLVESLEALSNRGPAGLGRDVHCWHAHVDLWMDAQVAMMAGSGFTGFLISGRIRGGKKEWKKKKGRKKQNKNKKKRAGQRQVSLDSICPS